MRVCGNVEEMPVPDIQLERKPSVADVKSYEIGVPLLIFFLCWATGAARVQLHRHGCHYHPDGHQCCQEQGGWQGGHLFDLRVDFSCPNMLRRGRIMPNVTLDIC
jgi:hypothetical protein